MAERRPVDDPDRRRNKLTTIHGENKALLHFSERNRAGRKRTNDRGWPSTSARGIECVAGLEDEHGEQKRTEGSQESADSFHTGSYHALGSCNRHCTRIAVAISP